MSPNLPVPVVAGAVLDPPAPSAPVPAQADTDAQLVAALAWNVPSCPGRGLRLALGDVGLSLLRRGRPALLGSISSHSLSHHPAVFWRTTADGAEQMAAGPLARAAVA